MCRTGKVERKTKVYKTINKTKNTKCGLSKENSKTGKDKWVPARKTKR